MANYLKMKKRQHVVALLELGWSYRKIERETGVRRETISRYDQQRESNPAKVFPGSGEHESPLPAVNGVDSEAADSNAAKVFPGSEPNAAKVFLGVERHSRSQSAPYQDVITAKLDKRLSLQRIWQDLVEDYGYGGSYESVKRFVRTLDRPARLVGIYHSLPGEEAQVDFFRGAPTFDEQRGQWRRPWVFRMTLCHSRHGYEEAVWDQKLETFLRLHENAFRFFGGVPQVVRQENVPRNIFLVLLPAVLCARGSLASDAILVNGPHLSF